MLTQLAHSQESAVANGRFAPRHRSFLRQQVAAATPRRSNAGLVQMPHMRKRKLTVRAPVGESSQIGFRLAPNFRRVYPPRVRYTLKQRSLREAGRVYERSRS